MDEQLSEFAVGFLGERFYAIQSVAHLVAYLHIAIARLGARRFHTHRQQSVVVADELESLANILLEGFLVVHVHIGRRNNQIGIFTLAQHPVASPRHTRCCVAVDGLRHEVVLRKVGQLLAHQVSVVLIGVDVYVLSRDDSGKPIVGLLQLCAARAKEINKLLGVFLTADGPKATTFATSQDDAKIFISCVHAYLGQYFSAKLHK